MSARCFEAKETMWSNELDSHLNREGESAYDACSVSSEWPDEQSTSDIKERMRKLFETQSYTDVTFFPKNNRKVSISAHRAVLAIGSPLFTKMLFVDENKDPAGKKLELEINNIGFGAFTSIVKYLYTDEVFFESDAQVKEILQGAKEFNIPSLVSRCEKHFETMPLSTENVCSKLQMSISNKISALKDRCVQYIQSNTLQVVNSSDFLNSNHTTVRTICNLQSLNLRSEMELLRVVMIWLQAQPIQSRKQMIQMLLKCFRFLTFTVEEMGDTLKAYPEMMTAEEGLKILLYLYNPPKTPNLATLPPWCNKNTKSRCLPTSSLLGSTISLKALNLNDPYVGKVKFPLKINNEQKSIVALTSLLQMKCTAGVHHIKAIKLAFQPPVSDRSVIGNLSISVHVHPNGFNTSERIQIGNSESVLVEFSKIIKVRTGDLVDIEVDAKDVKFYRFLQFDESGNMPQNPHFKCCVSSRPKEGKMYFISELEYGPQENNRPLVRNTRRPRNKT